MQKTNAALLVVVLALLAFVTVYERHTLSTGETAQRGSQLLPELVRERLSSITVERGAERYALARGPSDADGRPTFQFTHTQAGSVDGERVLAALSTVEWAEPLRTLSRATAADRTRHGLDRPRLLVRFEVASESMVLAFGAEEPSTGGVYVDADGKVFVVGREVFEAFDHDGAFFRVRRFAQTLPSVPSVLEIVTQRGDVRIARVRGAWRMERPFVAAASEGRANVVLSFLRTLEAIRFVEERPVDLARYGLTAPAISVTVGDAERPSVARLVVGSSCEGETRARFARFGDGPVVCVASDELEPLDVDVRSYLELRALSAESEELEGIELQSGRSTLSVAEEEGELRFRLGSESGAADQDAWLVWLEGLRAVRATEVEPVPEGFSPTITLTLHRKGARPDEVIRFAVAPDAGLLGRRDEDGVVLRFPRELRDRLAVTTMHVRDLGLIHEEPSSLHELRIVRRSGTEVLRSSRELGLTIVEPVTVPADSERLADLAARLAGLEAVRFVADAPRSEHGLASPRVVVSFAFRATSGAVSAHTLRIGDATADGTSFAQLDDSPRVFALVEATVELVATPLASRAELRTDPRSIERIIVRSGERTVRLERDGQRFRLGSEAIEDARANAALRAIAELDPLSVADYGASEASLGLARSAVEIRLRRSDEAGGARELVLRVGDVQGEGEAARRAVRRSDSSITYWVPSGALDDVLSLAR